jgi:hypothetical protein
MSFTPEKIKPCTLEEMQQRVEALQPVLSQFVDLGLFVHDFTRPNAPQRLDALDISTYPTAWYVSSMNYNKGKPVSDDLCIELSSEEHIDIDKYNGPNLQMPVWTFSNWFPYDEDHVQRTRIKQFHEQSRATFPLDVEVGIYTNEGKFVGFLDYDYENQESHIDVFMGKVVNLVIDRE